MILLAIIAATLLAGIGSVWTAALLLRAGMRKGQGGLNSQHLLSLAAGALLATAFMHLLPEAFESRVEPTVLFGTLLFGLVFFFLLDKAQLWHHGHEHHGDADVPIKNKAALGLIDARVDDAQAPTEARKKEKIEAHGDWHGHDDARRTGGWTLLTGDAVHCFGDGILIASAFIADLHLGLVAALAVLVHEVPHHIGDLIVLRQSLANPRGALLKVSLAGTMTAVGGLAGWWLLDELRHWLPFFLVLAASSFVYVALADLIPQLHKRLPVRQTVQQVLWLGVGILLVAGVGRLAHGVSHGQPQQMHGRGTDARSTSMHEMHQDRSRLERQP